MRALAGASLAAVVLSALVATASAISDDARAGSRFAAHRGDVRQAERLARRAAVWAPWDPDAALLHARAATFDSPLARASAERRESALRRAERAVRLSPVRPAARRHRAEIRLSLGDYPGAIQALNKALSLSPDDMQAESLLGWAQMLNEEYDAALTTFNKVLTREPANSLALINVGYVCLKKQMFGEAIEHLSKAIRLDNDKKATLYAHYYLGLVYLERDMAEDAQTFFEKTLKLGPNLIEAYYELGRAKWRIGDREGAQRTWEQGYKANKFNPWGKRCKEALDVVAQGQEPPR